MNDFEGLIAVVTGAASGIGRATAQQLQARGARVGALDLTPATVDGADVRAVECDITDQASVNKAVATVLERFGRIDVLVNNAGIGAVGAVTDNEDEEWHRVLDVNVVGIARMCRACLPYLRRSPAAAVVNTCSVAANVGLVERALYSASKGAVQALTLAMAADHISEGIRVNCVNPGTAATPWVERLLAGADDPAAARHALEARQPLGRLGTADEIADAICYLASPRASFVTGTILRVDGGLVGVRVVR